MAWALDIILNVFYAGIILLTAFIASSFARSRILKLSDKYEHIDKTLFHFAATLIRYIIIGFALVFVLGRFGVQTTSLVAVIGAAGLAIGLALQGTLSNIAAGVMLIAFRPFKIGQVVEIGGQIGTVVEINLFTTMLKTGDNIAIIIPNNSVWSGTIRNYSHYPTRRVDLTFGVSYSTNLKDAETILNTIIGSDERIKSDPEPFVKVGVLGASSVDFTTRCWVDADDYWGVHFDLQRAVKDAFDDNNIEIPFPTTTIYTVNA